MVIRGISVEIGKITGGVGEKDEGSLTEVDSFVLGRKGLQAAEGYLLGRFHLYTQVYMHKTTRSAEKMLGALLGQVADGIKDSKFEEIGLADTHPLVSFIRSDYKDLNSYLELDDVVLSALLLDLCHAKDANVSELADRLRHRRLYKCFDVGELGPSHGENFKASFRMRLQQEFEAGNIIENFDVLEDQASVSAYKYHEYESAGALEKILIRSNEHTGLPEDISRFSDVIAAINERKIYRVYARDEETMKKLDTLRMEVTKQ